MYYKLTESIDLKEIGHYPKGVAGGIISEILLENKGQYGPIELNNSITPILPIHSKVKLTDYFGGDNVKKFISPKFYDFLKPYLSEHQVWDMQLSNDVYKFDKKNNKYILKHNAIQVLYGYKILHINYPIRNLIKFPDCSFYKFKNTHEFIDYDDDLTLTSEMNLHYKSISEKTGKKVKVRRKKIIEDNIKVINELDFLKLIDNIDEFKKRNNTWKELDYLPNLSLKKLSFRFDNVTDEIFRIFIRGFGDFCGYYVSEKLKVKIENEMFSGLKFTPINEINSNVEIEIII
jgi:hypothetical protein